MDLKTLGKVANFSGKKEDWALWSVKFECWLALIPDVGGSSVSDLLDRATSMNDEKDLDIISYGAEAKQIAHSIYYLLVQLVGGRALAIARKTTKGNGLLARKRLKKEYEDAGGHRSVAILMGLMNPQ